MSALRCSREEADVDQVRQFMSRPEFFGKRETEAAQQISRATPQGQRAPARPAAARGLRRTRGCQKPM